MANFTRVPTRVRPLDGSWVRQEQMGGSGEAGEWVYTAADSDVEVADGSALATADAWGMILPSHDKSTFVAGDMVEVCWLGRVAAFSDGTPGARGYVSDDAGETADAMGTVDKCMGYFESAEIFVILPGLAPLTS